MTGEPLSALFLKRLAREGSVVTAIAIGFYLATSSAWSAYQTNVGYHAVVSFLAISCASASLFQTRENRSPLNVLLLSAFLFAAVIHMADSIEILMAGSLAIQELTLIETGFDLIELSLIGIAILIGVCLERRLSRASRRVLYSIALCITLLALGLRIIVEWSIVVWDWPVLTVSYFAAATAVAALTVSGILLFRHLSYPYTTDRYRLLFGPVLLALSVIPLMVSLGDPTNVWIISALLQMAAFFVLYLAMAMPILRGLNITRRRAYAIAYSISILVVAPFLVTVCVETVVPGFIMVDFGAYATSQVGIAAVFCVMAQLLMLYSRRKPAWSHNPLILLFLTQAFVESLGLLLTIIMPIGGASSYVPYIVGSATVSVGLFLAIRWIIKPPSRDNRTGSWVLASLVLVMLLCILGEGVRRLAFSCIPWLAGSPIGPVILLVTNLVNVFGFLYLILLILRVSAILFPVEVRAVGFLSLWIVPNILRAIYPAWTAGWWIAEILLLLGMLAGPALLGAMYMESYVQAEESRKKATLYGDILVHDIGNYHQAILSALELLETQGLSPDVGDRAITEARLALGQAVQLASTVRQLSRADVARRIELAPIDLAGCITEAMNQVSASTPELESHLLFNHNERFYVDANSLLTDLFVNLFRNAVQHSPGQKRIDVEITPAVLRGKDSWSVRVIDYGSGIDPETKRRLFSRFMEGATGTGLGLSVVRTLTELFDGQIEVEDRVLGSYQNGSVFVIGMPISVSAVILGIGMRRGLERAMHAALTGLYPLVIVGPALQAQFAVDFLKEVASPLKEVRAGYEGTLTSETLGTFEITGTTRLGIDELPPTYLVLDLNEQRIQGGTECRFLSRIVERMRGPSYRTLMSVIDKELPRVVNAARELTTILSPDMKDRDAHLAVWKGKFNNDEKELVYDIILGRTHLGRVLREAGKHYSSSVIASADQRLVPIEGRVLPLSGLTPNESKAIERNLAAALGLAGLELISAFEQGYAP